MESNTEKYLTYGVIGIIVLFVYISYKDDIAYNKLKRNPTIAACDNFIDKFSDSEYIHEIYNLKDKLEQEALLKKIQAKYESVKLSHNIKAYFDFINEYPDNLFLDNVKEYIKEHENEFYNEYLKPNSEYDANILNAYIDLLPKGKYVSAARQRIEDQEDDLAYESALRHSTISSIESYIKNFPKGKHINEAKSKLRELRYKEECRNNSLYNGSQPYSRYYGSNESCNEFGCSEIKITSSGSSDVIVLVKQGDENGDVVRHAYITKDSEYIFEVPNGVYQVFFYYGEGWYPNKNMKNGIKGGFLEHESFQKGESEYLNNQKLEYTLYNVLNGNFQPDVSNMNEAF